MAVLAQLNLARLKVDWDDDSFAGFRNALDPVNAVADASPGFVWRMVSEGNPSEALVEYESEGWLVNLTTWESLGALQAFVRSPEHLAIMRRKAEWFTGVEAHLILWWHTQSEPPSFDEALRRRELLVGEGPSPEAFNFRETFPSPQ